MRKIYTIIVLSLLIFEANAQTISGTIKDANTNERLIGVNIILNNGNGTATDFDGNYSIEVSEGAVLEISFIGYQTMESTVGSSDAISVSLQADNELDEIVLTALGLEKKKDDDLSSTTKVEVEQLQRSGESGVLQGLSGKTSGVNITRNSGDPGSGAYIQLRGQNTINGDNSPLIVLDGAIISNSAIGGSTGGVVQQSRLNDINPEDIASVTVIIFFSVHLLVARLSRNLDPMATMALAMFSYFTKVILMGAFLVLVTKFTDPASVDRMSFAISAILIIIAWLFGEIRSFLKLRLQLPLPSKEDINYES